MNDCPFCRIETRDIFLEDDTVMAFYDKYPVTRGHTLVVPKKHYKDYLDPGVPHASLWDAVDSVVLYLKEQYVPDGFNIGINVGEAAGQTVPHLHIHVIPRYQGDMQDPRGGVRGVIPEKQKY